MKLFIFEHTEGTEVLVANNAKEAATHYFMKYQDDAMLADLMLAEEGIRITEVQEPTLTEQIRIFDEEVNEYVHVSYQDIIDGYTGSVPDVLLCPSY